MGFITVLRNMKENCEICGTTQNLDRHHVIHKGIGGTKDPVKMSEDNLMTLCRGCHNNLHSGRWELVRGPECIRVLEKTTGRQIMRRLFKSGVDVPALLERLNIAEGSLSQLLEALPYFSDEQLVEAFAYASSFGKRSWLLQAAILYEAQKRSIYGERSLEPIAKTFGIGLRQAEKYALVWRTFFARSEQGGANNAGEEVPRMQENVNIDVFSLEQPSWYVVAASETKDPDKWLAYAQDRKAEDPRYSVTALRQDIFNARQFDGREQVDDAHQTLEFKELLPTLTQRACPWIKPFCIRSGKPVAVEECGDCEFMEV